MVFGFNKKEPEQSIEGHLNTLYQRLDRLRYDTAQGDQVEEASAMVSGLIDRVKKTKDYKSDGRAVVLEKVKQGVDCCGLVGYEVYIGKAFKTLKIYLEKNEDVSTYKDESREVWPIKLRIRETNSKRPYEPNMGSRLR